MIISRTDRLPPTLAALAILSGLAAWSVFFRADLVLSHYDAKAHLVVARRVIDSLTPGWQQIGAVWLPLPHLIGMLPVQIDYLYRTGLAASLVSIVCFGVSVYALSRLVLVVTGSRVGATTTAALLVLNPNLLYLQATPMTEPLLLAVTSCSVLWAVEWIRAGSDRLPRRLGWALFAAAWTRYEAWAVIGALVPALAYTLWRQGIPMRAVAHRVARVAAWPGVAIAIFLVNSRATVGRWFVADGFFIPDPAYQRQALKTLVAIWWGAQQLSGYVMETVALLAAAWLVIRALARRDEADLLMPVTLFATAALPFFAFYEGHPFRIRYMIPTVAACALFSGIAVGATKRYAAVLAALVIGATVIESPPWSRRAPMLLEAQWDRPASLARRAVSRCLSRGYRGDKVLASMGSLAHYMQELSWEGFALRDFVHEGNGIIWTTALETGPAPHVGWMLVEQVAEGGDVLAERIRHDPNFTRGMTRVCEGGGVALYRRRE